MLNNKLTHITLDELSNRMMDISNNLELPKLFKEDLVADMKILNRFNKQPKIWSLRETGTVLVPVGMGVDPVYVSNYTYNSTFFYIDSDMSIVQIESKEALTRINQAPIALNRSMSSQELYSAVDGVLTEGCDYGIWGVFERAKKENFDCWSEWLTYFQNSGNKVMINFMAEALRIKNIK